MSTILVRNCQPSDAAVLAEIFFTAIHAIPNTLYTAEQKMAWAPAIDIPRWQKRIRQSQPFVASLNHQAVGFIELEHTGHIDCFYVAPHMQRLGVGKLLYRHLLAHAQSLGIDELFVEASQMAEPFFLAQGFQVVKENEIEIRGQWLKNKTMIKKTAE